MVGPRRVVRGQMDGKRVERSTVKASATFFAMYMALLLGFSLLVSLDGVDIATSFTAALSCLSTIGPGMTRAIGPAGSFVFFSDRTKLLLSVAMLMGRLEIYPILVLLSPGTWKR
jgi:trk system potassium uptake protein TrkH